MALVVENMPAKAEDARDAGSFPGRERFPGEGHGNPFQYSCLGNPMNNGVWRALQSMGSQSVGHDQSD